MSTFDDYLATLAPGPDRDLYEHVLGVVRAELPDAEEGTAYGMPAWKVAGKGVFSVMRTRSFLSLYPFSGRTLTTLAEQVAGFEQTKGSLHFTPAHPVSDDLVRLIVRTRLAEIGRR